MTLEKFGDILDLHGSASSAWPARQRAACEALLADNAAARALLQEHQLLEQALSGIAVPDLPGLESRVLTQPLPARVKSPGERLLDWLLPANLLGPHLWRPALAACLPLVFGILVGNYFSFGVAVESPGFDTWGDELYMLSLNDYTENLE